MPATAFTPSAMPRWSEGKASVRIAEELANRKAPPTPWPMRITIIQIAAGGPVIQVTDRSSEKTVKIAKPSVNMRTRPYMSPTRPKLTTSTAVATRKPMIIHSR